jgi:hypothetical protein
MSGRPTGHSTVPTPTPQITNVVKDMVPIPIMLKTSVELEEHGGGQAFIYVIK